MYVKNRVLYSKWYNLRKFVKVSEILDIFDSKKKIKKEKTYAAKREDTIPKFQSIIDYTKCILVYINKTL